jgi:lipopolysaccharide transport system ATP-binding protein
MMQVIQIRNLGKLYKINHENYLRYHTLTDLFVDKSRTFFLRNIDKTKSNWNDIKVKSEEFWALRDITVDIHEGERIGIIGRNGAGKTTLLKILSRITEPTIGKITIKGKVASLLEVGTGFHPELTGRENIFLNGAILGMNRNEVKKKFEEIVNFSEIEKFLDTPVKRYSSGMYVRLAFAVAAHLEPDILLVDEVLAVGDYAFQKKCLGKMNEVANQNRTILFVSHNMNAIKTLCSRCIYLDKGKIDIIGNTDVVVNKYLSSGIINSTEKKWNENYPGDDCLVLNDIRLIDKNYNTIIYADINQRIGIEINYEILKDKFYPTVDIDLYTALGDCVFVSLYEHDKNNSSKGKYRTICWIYENLLNVESYSARIGFYSLSATKKHIDLKDLITFEVIEDTHLRGTSYMGKWPGIIRPKLNWQSHKLDGLI